MGAGKQCVRGAGRSLLISPRSFMRATWLLLSITRHRTTVERKLDGMRIHSALRRPARVHLGRCGARSPRVRMRKRRRITEDRRFCVVKTSIRGRYRARVFAGTRAPGALPRHHRDERRTDPVQDDGGGAGKRRVCRRASCRTPRNARVIPRAADECIRCECLPAASRRRTVAMHCSSVETVVEDAAGQQRRSADEQDVRGIRAVVALA